MFNVPFAAVQTDRRRRPLAGRRPGLAEHVRRARRWSSVGALICAVGFCLPLVGRRLGDTWNTWSTYRRLGALWRELRPVCAHGEPDVRISWWSPARLRVTQRESDIHDGMLSLYPYFDSEVRAKAYDAAVAARLRARPGAGRGRRGDGDRGGTGPEDDPEGRVISSATADAPAPPSREPP